MSQLYNSCLSLLSKGFLSLQYRFRIFQSKRYREDTFRFSAPLQLHDLVLANATFVFSPSEIFEQNKALESIPGNFTLYPHYYDSNPKTLELLRLMISQISPSVVVETGVANGASTRTILKAFQDFGLSSSKLFSLDIDPRVATDEFRSKENFNFILINETRNFSDAMKKVPTIDIFYHDSDHSYANQMHEYSLAWEKLSSNGVLISDDINWSNAFLDFSLKVRKRMFVLNDKTKLCGIIYKN